MDTTKTATLEQAIDAFRDEFRRQVAEIIDLINAKKEV